MTEHVTVIRSESVPIDSITPHPHNPRRGDMARIERSLREHGQYQDIVVHEETGQILVGNHRWRAAKEKLGWTHISAKFVSCTETKALEILAMDNRSSDDGRYDDAELSTLLEMIENNGNLLAAGYDAEDLDDLLARLEEQDAPAFDPAAAVGIDARKADPSYAASGVRSIVLSYPTDEYEQVVAGLQHMCQRYQCDDFATAVSRMIPELDD